MALKEVKQYNYNENGNVLVLDKADNDKFEKYFLEDLKLLDNLLKIIILIR